MKHIVEVTMTVEVTTDDTKFTEAFMEEFRSIIAPFFDMKDHAEHIAQLKACGDASFGYDRKEFVEGYGPIGEFGIFAEVTDTTVDILEEIA